MAAGRAASSAMEGGCGSRRQAKIPRPGIRKETKMKIDGGCHCCFISYEAEVDPAAVCVCRCTDCQTLSGSAFRTTVRATEGSFKVLSGKPKMYVKTAESGNRRVQLFCP